MGSMRRRDLLSILGGAMAYAALQLPAARAQSSVRRRRIGILSPLTANHPESRRRLAALLKTLGELGWVDARNMHIDYRLGAFEAEEIRRDAVELLALEPDVILANSSPAVGPLLATTRQVPIVFVQINDPVGAGHVASLAQPGGNATGFVLFEPSISGKWLELLREIVPRISRVAILSDSTRSEGVAQLSALRSAASTLGVELVPIGVNEAGEIERGLAAFTNVAGSGIVMTAGSAGLRQHDLIVALAERHRLPGIYPYRLLAARGGLMSYGPDTIEPYRRAAHYIDRILKGERPADLPVQQPTRSELVINRKAAKTLGVDLPPTLLARADEIIF